MHSNAARAVLFLFWLSTSGCIASASSPGPEAVVSDLVALLHSPQPDTRRTAALSLGKIALPESAAALIQTLRDPDPLVRQYSAWALGNIGEYAPVETALALAALLYDPLPDVVDTVAEAIGKMPASARVTERVIEAVHDPRVTTRRAAVKALRWMEASSAYDVLVQALKDPDTQVRQGAIAALGELGDRRAVTAMQDRLLHDSAVGVRSEAAYRLGKSGSLSMLPVLQRAVSGNAESSVERWARWAIEQTRTDEPGSTISPNQ